MAAAQDAAPAVAGPEMLIDLVLWPNLTRHSEPGGIGFGHQPSLLAELKRIPYFGIEAVAAHPQVAGQPLAALQDQFARGVCSDDGRSCDDLDASLSRGIDQRAMVIDAEHDQRTVVSVVVELQPHDLQ